MPKRPGSYRPVYSQMPEDRKNANARGYTSAWSKAAKGFLKSHPLCKMCTDAGLVTAAQCVDHIKPHRGDKGLFWDHDNWQALCNSCHSRKTAAGE